MLANESLANRYREVAVKTANPVQLVVILYDAAIQTLEDAKNHIRQNNIEGRSRSLNQCVSIITELQACLNQKEGGEIASSLNRLYDYMRRRIFKANVDQSIQPLEEVRDLLENIRSAWQVVVGKTPSDTQQNIRLQMSNRMAAGNSSATPSQSFNISV